MVEILKNSIEILKQRILFNLDLITQNESKIKEILKEHVSEIRSEKLKRRFNFNKKMLKENNDALTLQKGIINFIENYHNEIDEYPDIKQVKKISSKNSGQEDQIMNIKKEDYLDLTINGAMDFDKHHPYFNDKDFFNELLSYFSEIEDYEMCSKLTNLINENKSFKI